MKKLFTLIFVLTFSISALFAQKPLEANDIQENFENDGSSTVTAWFFQDPDMNTLGTIADPADGTNTVADYNRSGSFEYTNAQFILAHRMDLSTRNVFSLKVYFPSANDYTGSLTPTAAVKLQNSLLGGNAWSTQEEVKLTVTDFDQWVDLEFDFSGVSTRDDFDQVVIQFGGEGHLVAGQFYFDDLSLKVAEQNPLVAPNFPVNFEQGTIYDYTWTGFGDASYAAIPAEVIANPVSGGLNTSANVLEINKTAGAQTWAGASMNLDGAADLTGGTIVTFKAYSPRANVPVLFKMEDSNSPLVNGNPSVFVEVSATVTAADTWETLVFDLSTAIGFDDANSYDRVIIFPDFGAAGAGELFYFDDLELGLLLPNLPITHEEGSMYDYGWSGFGDASYGPIPTAVVNNPDAAGENTSDNVVEINKTAGAQTWAGASLYLDGVIDYTVSTIVKVKVYSPRADVPILFKVENSANADIKAEVLSTTTLVNTWEVLEFDISQSTVNAFSLDNEYDVLSLFPDFGNVGAAELFYFDDIELKPEVTGFDELNPINFKVYPNPASDYLYISNSSDLKRIEIYSITGQKLKIFEFVSNKVQIAELPQGVYVLSADSYSGEIFTSKFFKN